MISIARVDSGPLGHVVLVDWGRTTEVSGPYRWLWLARLVAWLDDGEH